MKKNQFSKKLRFKISPLYLIMAVVVFFFGDGYNLVIYTICVILHELAHAEIASRLGYGLTTLKLMPYGASLTGSFEGVKQADEILIALAGPIFNILLAIPAVALWWLVPYSYAITYSFVLANVFIAIFNMIPVFPLDGGRILLALLTKRLTRKKAYSIVKTFGFIFSGLFAALFALSSLYKLNISFAIIAAFMFASSAVPDKNSKYERLYSMAFRSDRLKRGLPIKEIMVDKDSTILSLTRMLSGGCYTKFIITDFSLSPIKQLSEVRLEELSLLYPPSKRIIDII